MLNSWQKERKLVLSWLCRTTLSDTTLSFPPELCQIVLGFVEPHQFFDPDCVSEKKKIFKVDYRYFKLL